MAFCQKCGAQQPDGSAFCGNCGTKLVESPQKRICPHCNHELAADMMFCDQCGSRYTEPYASRTYVSPPTPPVHNQIHPQYSTYSSHAINHTNPPIVNTGTLTVLSVICIFLCWPVAIYGFYCLGRANKAFTQEEVNVAIRRGTRACCIALGVIVALFMIGVLAGA